MLSRLDPGPVDFRSWPKAEITDTEILAHLSSALERKADISQPGVFISASDPKQNSADCIQIKKGPILSHRGFQI
jgi:hypothetical protein